jgi:hypothetical protein
MRALWSFRTDLGLFGSHIDVNTGVWTLPECSIGGGIDSYFEYLLKVHVAFSDDIEFGAWFQEAYRSVKMQLQRKSQYHVVNSTSSHWVRFGKESKSWLEMCTKVLIYSYPCSCGRDGSGPSANVKQFALRS